MMNAKIKKSQPIVTAQRHVRISGLGHTCDKFTPARGLLDVRTATKGWGWILALCSAEAGAASVPVGDIADERPQMCLQGTHGAQQGMVALHSNGW
jgi:hypothetical protein